MIKPRSSRLLPLSKQAQTRQNFSTGNGFGGSNLHPVPSVDLMYSVSSDTFSIADYQIPILIEQRSPLVIEASKIAVIAVWFWCLVGANYCCDVVGTIVSYCSPDI